VDPVRNERAVIRNRIRVREASTFCVVVGTNAGLTVGRNNNVTVEFTGTGVTTGFQCLMDRQEPYFRCKCLGLAQFMPHLVSVANRAHSNGVPDTNLNTTLIDQAISNASLLCSWVVRWPWRSRLMHKALIPNDLIPNTQQT